MRTSYKIGLAIVVLPLIAIASIPLLLDINSFRPMIESRVSTALSRTVTVRALSLSVMTGSIVANDLAIADDPKFDAAPFFTAKRLHIRVEMKPLILHHELIVRSFDVDSPQIHLIRAADGTWNFSTLSKGTGPHSATGSASVPDLAIDHIAITEGGVRIDTLPMQKNPYVYNHLNVQLQHFSVAGGFPFTLSASLPGDGKVDVSGAVGRISAQDAALTTFNARVSIQHLDLVRAGYVEPAAGLSMIADFNANITSDGVNASSEGKAHAEQLILLKGGKAAPYPVDVSYQVSHSLANNKGQLTDLALQTGAVAIHMRGAYQLAANVPIFDLTLLAQSVPINGLQAILPAVGAKLPNGATLKGGTLSANFAIKGTLKDNTVTGSYEIKDTTLLGYDLGSKIVGIAALGGIKTGKIVAIDRSRADIRITKQGSQSTNIYSVLPALGESRGSGTVSPSGELNFHLISKVAGAKGLNKVGVDLLTKLNSTSAAAKPSTAKGIPINITGTAENPVITADINGLMKGNATTLRNKVTALFDTGRSKIVNKRSRN